MFGDSRLPERFWDKVMPEPNTGCWLWTGHVTRTNTPSFQTTTGHACAHHVAFNAFISVPGVEFGNKVAHTCDEPTCCNPDHLYARPRSVYQTRKQFKSRSKTRANQFRFEDGAGNPARAMEATARWREANRKTVNETSRRARVKYRHRYKFYALKRDYGLTREQYESMLRAQNDCCAICAVAFASLPSKKTHVDHCHHTGRVRGILCHKCNLGVGMFDDNAENLSKAIAYLNNGGF